jgi:hypothetical protein
MAHLDPRFQHLEPADRACTWNTLAISALAKMVVAPMLVIGALLILEAVLPSSQHNVEALHGERPGAYARPHPPTVSLTRKASERSKPE